MEHLGWSVSWAGAGGIVYSSENNVNVLMHERRRPKAVACGFVQFNGIRHSELAWTKAHNYELILTSFRLCRFQFKFYFKFHGNVEFYLYSIRFGGMGQVDLWCKNAIRFFIFLNFISYWFIHLTFNLFYTIQIFMWLE